MDETRIPARASVRQNKHTRTLPVSYDAGPPRDKAAPARVELASPSKTRPPGDPGDLALWPSWTRVPLSAIDLDAFDDACHLLPGCSPVKGVA